MGIGCIGGPRLTDEQRETWAEGVPTCAIWGQTTGGSTSGHTRWPLRSISGTEKSTEERDALSKPPCGQGQAASHDGTKGMQAMGYDRPLNVEGCVGCNFNGASEHFQPENAMPATQIFKYLQLRSTL